MIYVNSSKYLEEFIKMSFENEDKQIYEFNLENSMRQITHGN
jgi:hypothetical protein